LSLDVLNQNCIVSFVHIALLSGILSAYFSMPESEARMFQLYLVGGGACGFD
jgi:hypothetical protein